MSPRGQTSGKGLLLVAVVSGLVCFAVAMLLTNIFERKQEALSTFARVVEIDDDTADPEL